MGKTVNELLETLDYTELLEWYTLDTEIEPIDPSYHIDLAAATISSTIANVNRTKNSKVFSPSDFMPKFEVKDRTTNKEKVIASANTYFSALKARNGD